MQLEHSFTVPVGVEDAWKVLLDIERIAPCMPGAAITSVDGDDFTGTVKVKLGPIGLTYKGKASFVEKDATAHRAVINAQGRDSRGNGTASAKVTATLTEESGSTTVLVTTDLDITGKPAQFGRGVMVDVGNKLIGQFADCLAGKLGEGDLPTEAPAEEPAVPEQVAAPADSAVPDDASATAPAAENADARPDAPQPEEQPVTRRPSPAPTPQAEVEPIDLLGSAGPAVAKRLAPVAAVAVLIALIVIRLRRRR